MGEQAQTARSKAGLVYDSLRRAIVEGDLAAGQRLNMDEIARSLGVSKIPVREAVKHLEADGLLVSRAHSGVSVAVLDAAEMRGVFLAREAVETLVAALAVERITAAGLEELESLQARMRSALDQGEVGPLAELNSRFHSELARAAGYRVLTVLTEQLMLTVRRYRVNSPLDPEDWRAVITEHEEILTALRGRDPRAVEATRAHIGARADHEVGSG
ncbi:GntR family transcriptional regulator [Kitasatospora sp. NPDC051853]|uniref:GntR family transcriptional regulator n=1 Tax=Kitasatospora sp. NPDC051853 TaxID=3364058 RepID=UPI0037A11CEB